MSVRGRRLGENSKSPQQRVLSSRPRIYRKRGKEVVGEIGRESQQGKVSVKVFDMHRGSENYVHTDAPLLLLLTAQEAKSSAVQYTTDRLAVHTTPLQFGPFICTKDTFWRYTTANSTVTQRRDMWGWEASVTAPYLTYDISRYKPFRGILHPTVAQESTDPAAS